MFITLLYIFIYIYIYSGINLDTFPVSPGEICLMSNLSPSAGYSLPISVSELTVT